MFFLLSSLRYCNRRYFSLYCLKFDKWTKRCGWFNTNKHVVIWNNNYITFLYPTHNKKRQWWSSQLLPRGTSAGVIENLFWWHQFVEILKTLSLRKNRGQTVVQSKQGSSSLPRKESNKRKSEKNCLLSWNLNEGAPQGTILGPRRISMSSVFSRTTKLIFEGTLKGSWELFYTRLLFN